MLNNKILLGKAYAAQTLDHSFCWKEIPWLKSVTKLRILKKGILTSEDALKAIEAGVAGVAGIIVSYHGARQLDYTPATIFVLEESCSHEMACNFIHCFRNPSGDYEWVDLDKPPPRYWLTKMASLFWSSDDSIYDRWLERKKSEWMLNFYKMLAADFDRFFSCSVISTTGDSRLPAFGWTISSFFS
ncbi:hypothetical protein KY285_022211 [Solanum tuberosum]|nr:hypothetical protein KY285_022211 [Solanum tuberosum]